MRLIAWNCNMALHRKVEALLALRPDVAVISECAEPERLRRLSNVDWIQSDPVWIGRHPTKGARRVRLQRFSRISVTGLLGEAPSRRTGRVDGPLGFNLLAVWAQNASGGVTRKHQLGPLRRALARYRGFLTSGPAVVAGDLNNNVIWDRPGWRINHRTKVDTLAKMGLVSVYHECRDERQGEETVPTIYWRDRKRDGPTYHIDYIFTPRSWLAQVSDFSVGSFDDWCATGLSDHVPLVLDVDP